MNRLQLIPGFCVAMFFYNKRYFMIFHMFFDLACEFYTSFHHTWEHSQSWLPSWERSQVLLLKVLLSGWFFELPVLVGICFRTSLEGNLLGSRFLLAHRAMVESAAERQARNLAMLERSVQRHREEEEETLERPELFSKWSAFQWMVVVEDLLKNEIMKYR